MMIAQSDTPFGSILLLAGITAALIAGGIAVVWASRRWLRSDADASAEPFTLQDLREMRERGEITPQEYDAMRAMIIGKPSQASGQSAAGLLAADPERRNSTENAGTDEEPPSAPNEDPPRS
jgi:hypothetical protein